MFNIRLIALTVVASCLALGPPARAGNPIVIGQGLTSPKVRIYNNRAYLYGAHDAAADSKYFLLNDWWVWASDDLVNWKCESVLKPDQTYWRKPYDQCWANVAGFRDGKYYWYFSRGNSELGVVVGDSPIGPWKDPLGKPLVAKGSTPVPARDPALLQEDDGTSYLAFGVWDYYIAKLNPDMISLAETPRVIGLDRKMGPYGPGKLDDKPNLHEYNGRYYLSWGCFYAMADNVYGPYTYKGSVIHKDRTTPAFQQALMQDRQGSFFEFHHQWYFACNDQSWPGSNRYFRNSVMGYVHYRENGEIEPIYLDELGVGQYDAKVPQTEAENYFDAHDVTKQETSDGGFEVAGIRDGSWLSFPRMMNIPANATLSFRTTTGPGEGGTIEVHRNSADGALLGSCHVPRTGRWDSYVTVPCPLTNTAGTNELVFVFRGSMQEMLRLDCFSVK